MDGRRLPTPAWLGLIGGAALLLGGGLVVLANVLDRGVVEENGCRSGPSVGRLSLQPGGEAYFSVPLPRGRSATARIEGVDPHGTIANEQLTFAAARTGRLGPLRDGSAPEPPDAARPLGRAALTTYEDDLLRNPRARRDTAPWSLVVGVRAAERGIFHLSSLDVTYKAGKRTSMCKHDLSISIAVGARAPDFGRQAPVYPGVGYGHALHTHCGIFETSFGGLLWTADPALHDGSGNPPPFWSDPTEVGTMRLVAPTVALFQTRDKLEARFRPRAPGDPPIEPCD